MLIMLLSGCGKDSKDKTDAPSSATEALTEKDSADDTENTSASTEKSSNDDKVADASEMTEVEEVIDINMTPVTADMLNDGEYDIDVLSSSSMFKIDNVTLKVDGGKLTVVMTMVSKSYLYVYPGTPEEAVAAGEDGYISAEDAGDDKASFTFEIPALDSEVKCAAFSKKKEKWYDRSLCFLSSRLPIEAYKEGTLATAGTLGLEDGTYSADVTIAGGSGKAKLESPASVEVKDGQLYATLVWGSSNYDYMIVDGTRYEAEIVEEHSTFVIPVTAFDYRQVVIADTTAMSKPYEIEYSIRFDSKSIEKQ